MKQRLNARTGGHKNKESAEGWGAATWSGNTEMHLILLMFLLVMIAVVSAEVLRRRREHRSAERAKALRYERWKARRQSIPHVSANLCGSSPEPTAPVSRPPPLRAA